MHFTHIPIESSNLKSIAYNEEHKVLEVVFLSGDKYQYKDVSVITWNEFQAAESKNRYFAMQIKPNFKHRKVNH